jgi:integrase
VKIKIPVGSVRIFTDEELAMIFDYTKKNYYDDYLFIDFLYYTAFRFKETYNLKISQYKTNGKFDDYITLISKNKKKTDKFPIDESLRQKIERIEDYYNSKDRLFESWIKHYTTYQVHIRQIMEELGIYKYFKTSAHTFRRTRISYWLYKKKLPITQVADLARNTIEVIAKHYAYFDDYDILIQYLDE